MNKSRTWEQITIIIVRSATQSIIIGIDGAGRLKQFHFIIHAPLAEYAYGFGGVAFDTVVSDILRNDFLHAFLYLRHILQSDGPADAQIAEVSLGYGVLYKKFAIRKEFADCLVEYKTKRTYICTHPRRISYIQKLYILIVIYTKVESFRTIIYFSTDYLIRKIKIETVINIQK